jgi:hypothetical protein
LPKVENEEVAVDVENVGAVTLADRLVNVVDDLEDVDILAVAEREVTTGVAVGRT